MPADTNVSLVISGTTQGLAQVNRQLAALQKRLMGLTRASGLVAGKGAVKGVALTSWMTKMGFSKAQVGKINAYYKDMGIALRANRMELTKSAPFLKRHGEAMGLLGRRTQKAGKQIKETGRNSYYAGMMLTRMGYAMVAVSAALTVMGIKSLKVFGEFQANLIDIQALAGLTDEQMRNLGEGMRELSKVSIFSATEITKAGVALARTGIIASHGFDAYNKVLEASIILTTAFWRQGVTLEQSVETTTRTIRQFNLSADDSNRVINALAAGSAYTLAKITDLQKGLSYAGAAAKSMGVSLEETVAALGMLANVGITAGRAGRQFRNIMVRLGRAMKDPTAAQRALLQSASDLNVQFSDMNIKARGLPAVLNTLKFALEDVADASTLVRMRAAVAALVLAKQSGEFEKLVERISTGTKAFEMYDKQMSTLLARWKVFTNNVQALAIVFGSLLEPAASRVLETLTGFIQKFDELSAGEKRLILLTTAFIAFSLALSGVFLIMKGFLISAMFGWKKLAGLVMFAGGVFLKVTVIIGSLLVVAMLLRRTLDVLFSTELIETWKTKIKGAISAVIDKYVALINWNYKLLQTLLMVPTVIRRAFKDFAAKGSTDLQRLTQAAKDFNKEFMEEFFKTADIWELGLGEKFKHGFKEGIVSPLKESMKIVKEEFRETFGEMVDYLKQEFPQASVKIDAVFGEMEASIRAISETLGMLGEQTKAEAGRMKKVLIDLTGTTDDIIKRMSATWSDNIVDMVKGIKTWKEVWDQVLDDALRNFVEGFLRGLLEAHGQALGKMVAQWWTAQTAMGMGAAGKILSIGASIFGGLSGAGAAAGVSGAMGGPLGPQSAATSGPVLMDLAQALGGTKFGIGGIIRRPTLGMVGESGPEAVVPLDEYDRGSGLTIVNVVDPNFVNAQIMQSPDTVVNVINADMLNGGPTRRTIKRIK